MNAKRYLNQIRRLEQNVQQRLVELKKLREEATILKGVSYDGLKVQSSNQSTGFAAIERIVDKEHEVMRMVDQMQSVRHKIIMQIQALSELEEDGLIYSSILFDRYVNYADFAQIACTINRSYTHTIRLHGEALKAFSRHNDIR